MGVTVNIHVDESLVAAYDALAAETNTPRDVLMREAVERYAVLQAAQIAHIKQGIAELDRGERASEEELDALEAELEALARATA